MTPARLVVVMATLVAMSCQPKDRQSSNTSQGAGASTASAGSTSAAASPVPCGVDARTMLTGDGIGELRVGVAVDRLARSCRIVQDTVVRGVEGIQERRIVVDLGRGSVMAVVDSSRIWRLHVQSPAFRTADSLGVGSPASSLRRRGARLLTGEGAHFVTLPSHCGLSFRLRGVAFGRVRAVEQIPDGATVGEVLVVGCRASSS